MSYLKIDCSYLKALVIKFAQWWLVCCITTCLHAMCTHLVRLSVGGVLTGKEAALTRGYGGHWGGGRS